MSSLGVNNQKGQSRLKSTLNEREVRNMFSIDSDPFGSYFLDYRCLTCRSF